MNLYIELNYLRMDVLGYRQLVPVENSYTFLKGCCYSDFCAILLLNY